MYLVGKSCPNFESSQVRKHPSLGLFVWIISFFGKLFLWIISFFDELFVWIISFLSELSTQNSNDQLTKSVSWSLLLLLLYQAKFTLSTIANCSLVE